MLIGAGNGLCVSVVHNLQFFHDEIDDSLFFVIAFMASLLGSLAEFGAVYNGTYLYDDLVLTYDVAEHIGRIVRNT